MHRSMHMRKRRSVALGKRAEHGRYVQEAWGEVAGAHFEAHWHNHCTWAMPSQASARNRPLATAQATKRRTSIITRNCCTAVGDPIGSRDASPLVINN